jgi:glutathionylspermidine synthase
MFVLNKEMMTYALDNKRLIEEDYRKTYKAVGNSNAVYKGKQLPFLYYPSVYSTKDVKRFEELTRSIYKIVNKSINIYVDHPEVRSIWGFSKELEELILVPHRFTANVPMGRFDFFYYEDGSYKFCELNTDGTSAMNEETPLSDILLETQGMKHMKSIYQISRYELYQSWVDEVESIYAEFVENGGDKSDKPYVIIMDFVEKGSPHEFEEFKIKFLESGYDCDIVSPDSLVEKDGYLYANNKKVDIIYRRLVTRDMMDKYDLLQPLIRGIKANKTCIIGSIKSQIVHTKKYFEALYHPLVRQYFNQDELDYIDKHIPYTAALVRDDNFDKYVKEKDQFIIKPIDLYASKGVYAGKEFSEEEWIKLLEEGIETGYIIQEFCKKSMNQNLYFDDHGEMHVKTVNNITGLFLYNEKLKGIFTRAGFNAVISDLNDGYSLSSVVVKEPRT